MPSPNTIKKMSQKKRAVYNWQAVNFKNWKNVQMTSPRSSSRYRPKSAPSGRAFTFPKSLARAVVATLALSAARGTGYKPTSYQAASGHTLNSKALVPYMQSTVANRNYNMVGTRSYPAHQGMVMLNKKTKKTMMNRMKALFGKRPIAGNKLAAYTVSTGTTRMAVPGKARVFEEISTNAVLTAKPGTYNNQLIIDAASAAMQRKATFKPTVFKNENNKVFGKGAQARARLVKSAGARPPKHKYHVVR